MSRYHIPEFRDDPRKAITRDAYPCEACDVPTARKYLVKRGEGMWVDYVCPACAELSDHSRLEQLL